MESRSYERAAREMSKLAEVEVSAKQCERVTQRIGGEWCGGATRPGGSLQPIDVAGRDRRVPPGDPGELLEKPGGSS